MSGRDVNEAAEDTEVQPIEHLGWYNASKALAERFILDEAKEHPQNRLKTVVVRLPLVWGCGDNVLKHLVNLANTLRWCWIGGGRHRMSVVHVRNASHGIVLAMEGGDNGDVYHLTDGDAIEFRSFFCERFGRRGVSSWKLHMSLPVWMAWLLVWAMSAIWRLFGLRGLPLLTKTGLYYSSKNFTITDQKARAKLGYVPIVSYKQGMDEIAKESN
eukprot:gene5249-6075_t